MMDDFAPRTEESVPVILARMEGKINGIDYKVTDLGNRLGKVEDRVTVQENLTLILSQDAKAEEAKKIALALALKEADETRRNQSEQSWTPIQRFMAILASVVGAVSLAIYLYSTIKVA